MMKTEFERLIRREISEELWEIIETIYMYHPAFENVSKQEFAELYKKYGMILFADLYKRAKIIKELEEQKAEIERKIRWYMQPSALLEG